MSVLGRERILGEAGLSPDDAVRALENLASTRIKGCHVKILSKSNMRSLIIQNVPEVMNEKDFFLILHKATTGQGTPNLKRIVIADDSEVEHF